MGGEEPQERCDHERPNKVNDTIREPCRDIEDGVCETGEEIGNIRSI